MALKRSVTWQAESCLFDSSVLIMYIYFDIADICAILKAKLCQIHLLFIYSCNSHNKLPI